ncbi:MAG: adenylate kinase family protein [Ignisphaera sp.]|nr:adenylate kinase family protein [Ignisphaera sp.]MCX8168533.1 adenylate kinase family protein [Ignisphaera sp.]MDW8085028.1 adenylate kinase family protein [Ignisphaera sp.]
MRVIGVSGVPGTGKTSLARTLSEYLEIPMINLSDYTINNMLVIAYDPSTQSYIVDEERLRQSVLELYRSRGPLVIESHYVEVVPREIFEVVFVLRRAPDELLNVLLSRGWSGRKVAENIEAELLSVCTVNAVEELGEDLVIEVDVSGRDTSDVAREVIDVLFGDRPAYYGHRIDWLSILSDDRIEKVIEFIEKNGE